MGSARGLPRNRREMAACVEAAALHPTCTRDDVSMLVARAVEWGLRAVCVNSCDVWHAVQARGASNLLVVSTVGFPFGGSSTPAKVREAEVAVAQGADELDVVINLGRFLGDEREACRRDLTEVVRAVDGVVVKAILEVGYLNESQVAELCRLAVEAGAKMLKTSTGFGPVGATPDKVAVMRRAVGPSVPIKAAGGVRDWGQALSLLQAGADLLGTSHPERILAGAPEAEEAL